jgi:hypothetical protein
MYSQKTNIQAEENKGRHAEAAAGKEEEIELHRVESQPDSPAQKVHIEEAISQAYASVKAGLNVETKKRA